MENKKTLDHIIFGDNQFFGINHLSENKAQALAEKFRDLKAITDVIDTAYDCGIRAFMLNTNEKAKEICGYLRENALRYPNMRLYPSIPYAHKYANAVAKKGIFGALKEIILSDNSASRIFSMIAKGGGSLFKKDLDKVMQLLIDVEMKMFMDLNVKVIFLQNIITDLLLGFQIKEAFRNFCSYIRDQYGVAPGFVTTNLPMLVNFLEKCEIMNPIICTSINKIGHSMNPNQKSYEKTLNKSEFTCIAMSVFASGAINPEEAVDYICSQPNINSIVFGASSKEHIEETKKIIEKYKFDPVRLDA
jgi:hypothetical protein